MSFTSTLKDLSDFERFFYDQVSFKSDFFEKPKPKMYPLMKLAHPIGI